jgi:hypothetical protein
MKKKLLAATLAAALSTGMIVSGMTPVYAAGTAAPATTEVTAKDKAAEKEFIKVSEETLKSMRNLNGARLAIFNGQPNRAKTYVDGAKTSIAAAVTDADKYALEVHPEHVKKEHQENMKKDRYVPFDAALTVANEFVPTKEKAAHIAKANEHLKNGEKKKAMEELKLGEIDVAVSASMVPVEFAKAHIDDAAKLIGEHKYYEANLALKAVDDAVVVETYAVDAVPAPKPKAATESTPEKMMEEKKKTD